MVSTEYDAYYAVIRRIPKGRVMTYGDVARAAGFAGRARRVGYALACCGDPFLPWWRVINARGQASRSNGRSIGADEQEHLLRQEGIAMDASGTVDLARYRFVIDPGATEGYFPEEREPRGDP
ncbi:MAG: MGMT family protein [bacterium]|nr:MGMT family protein [bacterium]MDE0419221.1 MGMT family protein [bacterium]